MGIIKRGYKNALRNGIRSASVVMILSISIGMSLIMLMSLRAVQNKIEEVKSSIGNTITVSPAGIRGFEGGGDLLTDENISKISEIDGVEKTIKTLSDHLSDNTSLQPAIEAGNFGRRQMSSQSKMGSADFKMPLMVTGTNDLSNTTNLNVSKFEITSGEKFNAEGEESVAMIGSELASKNNLSAGSKFTAYEREINVSGVFDGGTRFANTLIVMPIKTVQKLSDQEGLVNNVIVQVNSVSKIAEVESKIKDAFGDKADIISSQETVKQAVEPLENIKAISLYTLVGSLVAGAIILFLTMVMIVRERRREIGVLKAIGASNIAVTMQFAVEAMVLTLTSSIVGIIGGTLLSNSILRVLVSNNTDATSMAPGEGHAMMMRVGAGVISGAQGALRDLTTTVGVDIILYGVLAALIIAFIGSVIPSFVISKISPAEVMRAE